MITIDGRESGAGRDAARLLLGERRAASLQRRALQRALRRRAGNGRDLGEALKRYGTISLAKALAPAIRVARNGFVIDQTFFDQTQANVDWFNDIPASAALYLDPTARRTTSAPSSATPSSRTRTRGSRGAAPTASTRAVADALVDTVRNPVVSPTANHIWRPGVMTLRDLDKYKAPERKPTRVGYRGLDVYGMGPPSSGGSTVGEALNILEGYRALGDDSGGGAAPLHRGLALLVRRPRRLPRRSGVLRRAAEGPALGRVRGHAARADPGDGRNEPGRARRSVPVQRRRHRGGQASATETRAGTTTHISTADRWGNVVAYTFTIESTGGAGLVVPGYGFLANNELTDFNFDSLTHPNRVEGGKRPRSSMSPTIVLRHDKPLLTVGSPGGSTIITTVLQILSTGSISV